MSPVFLSYARQAGEDAARRLYEALGDHICFLDTTDRDAGQEFPRRLTDALLNARVVVAFIDETCFRRWYCLREWLLARAPFDSGCATVTPALRPLNTCSNT